MKTLNILPIRILFAIFYIPACLIDLVSVNFFVFTSPIQWILFNKTDHLKVPFVEDILEDACYELQRKYYLARIDIKYLIQQYQHTDEHV